MKILLFFYFLIFILSILFFYLLKNASLWKKFLISFSIFFLLSFFVTKFLINLSDPAAKNSRIITKEEIESW